jgi:adenine-specific DNA methylase
VAADLDDAVGKRFREPTGEEREAIDRAAKALADEPPFRGGLSAVPAEVIPAGNNDTVRPSMYGARTYGDLCIVRQTLGFVRLCRTISDVGGELLQAGCSADYASAVCGYASTLLVRKFRRATRGADLGCRKDANSNRNDVGDIFTNEASIAFSYDSFEAGIGGGPGTWRSLKSDTLSALRHQMAREAGLPARILRGSALSLPLRNHSLDAVITDPPYDNMIDYTDASDLFYVWLKRALSTTMPDFAITADPNGVQEKTEEAIVKRGGSAVGDHRTREHYDRSIGAAFSEARRLVRPEGVVTIVFGHGDPEVWHRLLAAISTAGLYLTGSWPAKTESGGKGDAANIVTTLTMSCRPVPPGRPGGRANDVRAEVRKEVRSRVPEWERSGLALTDQLMASAGPAMEVVGRYGEVLDPAGNPLDPAEFLVLARRVVEEAAAIQVEDLPLDVFDARTRFALFWARLFGRSVAAKSEARWQALAADLNLDELRGVLRDSDKGTRLAFASEGKPDVGPTSSVIDVALAIAAAWPSGLSAAAEVLGAAGRDAEDSQLFAAVTYLAARVPDADPDGLAWTAIVRNRRNLGGAVRMNVATTKETARRDEAVRRQGTLFESVQGGDGE